MPPRERRTAAPTTKLILRVLIQPLRCTVSGHRKLFVRPFARDCVRTLGKRLTDSASPFARFPTLFEITTPLSTAVFPHPRLLRFDQAFHPSLGIVSSPDALRIGSGFEGGETVRRGGGGGRVYIGGVA